MQSFDTVLKRLLQQFGERTLERLTGTTITRWLPTELPKIQNLRVDLLGETAESDLLQLEIQSSNDPQMPLRMLEYAVAIARIHGRIPKQVVLYIGRDPLRMSSQLEWSGGVAGYTLIDMREVDAGPLLQSSEPGDNVMGILGRLINQRAALRGILEKLSRLPRDQAALHWEALLVLAGLRGLEEMVQEEARRMPFTVDISENKVLGPIYRRGLEEGRQEGRQEGGIGLLRRQLERRFGSLPPAVNDKLSNLAADEVNDLALRLLDASSLEELFA